MFNDSSAVERVRRGGTSSSSTAKLVNMDVWYATTLWLALLSGWIDPSSGRRTRKNPTGGILMKPIMPPALLTPQQLDESYYYDQGEPIPHPAIPATYPLQGSQAFDSVPQRTRLWRSIDEPLMQTRPSKDNMRQFPRAFSPQKPPQGRPMNPSQRSPPNSQFHSLQPGMRGIGNPSKSIVPRPDPIEFDRRDSFSEEGPFGRGNPFNKGDPFRNKNPFNKVDSFNQGNPFNKGDPFNNGNPFSQRNPFSKGNPFNERDIMSDDEFGPTHEWSGRHSRQKPAIVDGLPPGLSSPPMEGPWEPIARYGSMRGHLPTMLGNAGRGGDLQARDVNSFEPSDSISDELISMPPRSRKGLARSMIPQIMNNPWSGPGPMPMRRLRQRSRARNGNVDALDVSRYPPPPMQYGPNSPDYFDNRHSPKVANRPLILRNTPQRSQMADAEEISAENVGEILKLPIISEKHVKSNEPVQSQDDEFAIESDEHGNSTTTKPSDPTEKSLAKETKSSEASDESKNVEDSRSSEESTTLKTSHKSKSQHAHKHKETQTIATESNDSVSKHTHGHIHHAKRAKSKITDSVSDESQQGSRKKRRPRTTLSSDFAEDKKEITGETVAVVETKKT